MVFLARQMIFNVIGDLLANEPCDHITDAMDPVFNRIMALPATTIDGLAVKADVVRHYYEKAFDEAFDADAPWDDLGAVRALVEAVSAMHRSPR
jgi:hypothetical protein